MGPMETPTTPNEMIEEIALRARRWREDREWVRATIRELLTGDDVPRGRLADVARASGWTREYVAQIRDGKAGA